MTAPQPLTPANCDLRGLPFMPLDVTRLFESDLFGLSTGDEFKAALALWGRSWLQVPAASIPNDDRLQARMAGVSPSEWKGLAPMALRGWRLCTDGRLYHPVVAEKALKVWLDRLSLRERSAKGNATRYGNSHDGASYARWMAEASAMLGLLRGEQTDPSGSDPDPAEKPASSLGEPETLPRGDERAPSGSKKSSEVEGEGEEKKVRGAVAQTGVKRASPRKPETALPDDFPGEPELATAREFFAAKGYNLDPIREAERFRLHHEKNDSRFRSWPAVWRTWLDKAVEFAPVSAKRQPLPVPEGERSPDAIWRPRLETFRKTQSWSRADYGPKPGKPGCEAPSALLAEFGFIEGVTPISIRGAA